MATLKNTSINDTGYLRFPVGTTAQRPSPSTAMMRYNSSARVHEYYDGTKWLYTVPKIYPTTNLISDPSVELNTSWSFSGSSRSNTYSLFGDFSIYFPNRSGSGLTMNTQNMPTPLANNIYYGGRWIFSQNANITTADNRFEWFLADNASSQMVFANNTGQYASWFVQTSRLSIAAPTAGSWIIRHFTVNQNGGDLYTDGHFIVNLTATFGSGSEPSKAWCDAYYSFPTSSFVAYENIY